MLNDAKERVAAYLHRTGLAGRARVVPLTGDASDRRYFRVIASDRPSTVLAAYADAFELDRLPFVNVAALFRAIPLPVPDIRAHAGDLGLLELEDLGDVTLQAHLGTADAAEHAALYREAVGYLAALQDRGRALADPTYLPYGVAFDEEKLGWELGFFARHFLGSYRGVELSAAEKRALDSEFDGLAGALAAEPRVLCHRDYHSRNLMLHDGRLCIIDFQDARMGPATYDLASLLRDSYVDLSEATVQDLLAYFLALTGMPRDAHGFRALFDLTALQRNLKALGTFGYQAAIKRNPVYIQYIPRTLRYARDTLWRHPSFSRIRDVLARHVPELG